MSNANHNNHYFDDDENDNMVMIMINLAKRASPLSPIVRAILAIPKYSKFGLHTFGCNKHKVFYVSTLNKEFTLG